MLHVVRASLVVCLALGVTVVILSFLAYVRFSAVAFRRLAALTGAALLIMLIDLLKEYDRAVPGTATGGLLPFFAVLSAVGFGLFAYSAPALALGIAGRQVRGLRRAPYALLVVLLVLCGAWKELYPGVPSALAVLAGMVVVEAYALVVLGTSLPSIDNRHVRQLARIMLPVVPLLLLAVVAQFVLATFGSAPALLRDYPVTQILSLLIVECLLLVFGMRYLFRPEPDSAATCVLPERFVENFSISPRECEIISMIVQGYNNRMIGEKLYISALTVKNHIYHIYQKTSAGNKVQLINLINTLK